MQGRLHNTPVVLACVYAPNWDNAAFFKHFFSALPDLNSHQLILSGDWNCVLHCSLDRSAVTPRPLSNSAKVINSFIEDYGVVDPWRFGSPAAKTCSFFSPPHQSCSRVDCFLLDGRILSTLDSVECGSVVVSGRGPVVLRLCFPGHVPPHGAWRLGPCLLSGEDFVRYMSVSVDDFLETGMDSVAGVGTVWEALRACLRGLVMSCSAGAHGEGSGRMNNLVSTIKDIDRGRSTAPSAGLCGGRVSLRTGFGSLASAHTRGLFLGSRVARCGRGERASGLAGCSAIS